MIKIMLRKLPGFLKFLVFTVVFMFFWLVFSFLKTPGVSIISPLPHFLTFASSDLTVWSPKLLSGSDDVLGITAKSALLYDLATEKTLFAKNPRERLPMASLTKIMTAIIALENTRDKYLVRPSSLVGEDSMGLKEGEVLTLTDLLYGLMLPSGNDASEVLADNFPGGRSAFIKAMNEKARLLGLSDTHFSNPSGLQGDGIQFTTASDMLVIAKYALKFQSLAKIASTYEHVIPATPDHKAYHLFNETNLLTSYPGVKGLKTGFTPEAGLCLVTYLEYKGQRIIGVILNSSDRRGEMKELLDYSLRKIKITPPKHS